MALFIIFLVIIAFSCMATVGIVMRNPLFALGGSLVVGFIVMALRVLGGA